MSNIIFYFSGTGNCLNVAKTIANELEDCEIYSMASFSNSLNKEYERIGFVYPTYFWGLPLKVDEFISNLKFVNSENCENREDNENKEKENNGNKEDKEDKKDKKDKKDKEDNLINKNNINNKNSYFFAITTHGGNPGNSLGLFNSKLLKSDVKLNYCVELESVGNYILMYNLKEDYNLILKKSHEKLLKIIIDIKEKKDKPIKKSNIILNFIYKLLIRGINSKDKDYNVNENCISCNQCVKLCPVNNIEIIDNKPNFKHNCELCMACIQYCPEKAINYKNKTQKRRRYNNPDISPDELIERNNFKY